jgi:hypothetical protein
MADSTKVPLPRYLQNLDCISHDGKMVRFARELAVDRKHRVLVAGNVAAS